MRRVSIFNVIFAATLAPYAVASSSARGGRISARDDVWAVGQTVQTTSGPVNGHAAPRKPDVSEYLGIPYAQPPVDDLRWQPPVQYTGTTTINADKFGFACMQAAALLSAANTGDLSNLTQLGASIVETYIKPEDDASVVMPQSEDCLTLNVWTKPQVGEKAKAVLVWIHGGSFTSGSSQESWYDGQYLSEEQDIVLVSLNYRLNIFGFSGNPLTSTNVGIQDQRMAIEWIRDNIAGFGGDPERIIIFGQSAGAASVDIHSFAYADDPIAAGYIPQSGTSTGFGLNWPPEAAKLWFETAKNVGCEAGPTHPQAVFNCMKDQTSERLASNIPTTPLGETDGLPFGPVIDGKIVFSNYDKRRPAARPMLIGNTDDESALFKYLLPGHGEGVPDSYWKTINNLGFTCPAGRRASQSVLNGNPTWRYRWFGVFPNLVLDWKSPSGAWHGSEIPSIFNQTPESIIPNTFHQDAIGVYMRNAWAAFAKDPQKGLVNFGWPEYIKDDDTLVRLSYNDTIGPNLDRGDAYDKACLGIPPVVSGGNSTAAATTDSVIASATTAAGDAAYTDSLLPIPLNWYRFCITGFWVGYFCVL